MQRTKRKRGSAGVRDRQRILWRDPVCRICNKAASVEVDHIKPLHKGGDDSDENKQGLCRPCHADKTNADMGWRERVVIGLDGWPVTAAL